MSMRKEVGGGGQNAEANDDVRSYSRCHAEVRVCVYVRVFGPIALFLMPTGLIMQSGTAEGQNPSRSAIAA